MKLRSAIDWYFLAGIRLSRHRIAIILIINDTTVVLDEYMIRITREKVAENRKKWKRIKKSNI